MKIYAWVFIGQIPKGGQFSYENVWISTNKISKNTGPNESFENVTNNNNNNEHQMCKQTTQSILKKWHKFRWNHRNQNSVWERFQE